jgi:hypothetical protein
MAWDDPSPRTRAQAPRAYPDPHPGYDAEPSTGRLLWCLVQTAFVGVAAAAGVHGCLVRWHGHAGRGGVADLVLAMVAGCAVGMLVWRYLCSRPGGGGWARLFWRRRFWADGYPDTAYTDIAVVEVVGEIVGDVIDAVID